MASTLRPFDVQFFRNRFIADVDDVRSMATSIARSGADLARVVTRAPLQGPARKRFSVAFFRIASSVLPPKKGRRTDTSHHGYGCRHGKDPVAVAEFGTRREG